MNSAVFNQVAQLLGTTDKNVVYTAILKTLTDAGMAFDVAYETVFGTGSYKKMAGQVYDSLKSA